MAQHFSRHDYSDSTLFHGRVAHSLYPMYSTRLKSHRYNKFIALDNTSLPHLSTLVKLCRQSFLEKTQHRNLRWNRSESPRPNASACGVWNHLRLAHARPYSKTSRRPLHYARKRPSLSTSSTQASRLDPHVPSQPLTAFCADYKITALVAD